ncbi:DNA polymerase III subunit delta [Zobellella denitrificans]|uniref:DNA polymerase III subunit delta n=1 Tax=Zobellella denitrificans TaxID=347534 RepID=A0A231MYB7_9GAMM|nr:DNA polymerase III subunit delta [Zobellella denitrificans]ATG74763.1 DNA polymerase III subunit delta [Zobellella denitrificans]OXS15221.1 DNA polymerase III subunit delta [Zobellella denitrificans]
MRLYPEQLPQHLKGGLAPCYFIYGDEPLLKMEALDQLRRTAREQGFDERHRFDADEGLDWDLVFDASQSLSLFSARQIIELHLPDKLDKTASERLRELLRQSHPDLMLLIAGPRLNQQQQKAAWFKALAEAGPLVPVTTPDARHLPRWLGQRLHRHGLQAEPDALHWLAYAFEGNLLALAGEIEKLSLLALPQPLTLAALQQQVQPHHHFNPFQLFDPLLQGKIKRACRILLQLRQEGVEAGMLCHLLARELDQLQQLQLGLQAGQSFHQAAAALHVWSSRQPLLQAALGRLPPSKLHQLQVMLAAADQAVAAFDDDEAWRWLYAVCVGFLDDHPLVISP